MALCSVDGAFPLKKYYTLVLQLTEYGESHQNKSTGLCGTGGGVPVHVGLQCSMCLTFLMQFGYVSYCITNCYYNV